MVIIDNTMDVSDEDVQLGEESDDENSEMSDGEVSGNSLAMLTNQLDPTVLHLNQHKLLGYHMLYINNLAI